MALMTVFVSLFGCAAADVTYERVRALIEEQPPESLTLEFKERYSASLPKSIAAMANSYGGLIIVGVADSGADRIRGVPSSAITQVVNGCYERLEPPWEPEIIPVPLPGDPDNLLLVVRVDPTRAPRPIMLDGTVPVRLTGRNATADRSRIGRLFAEAAPAVRTAGRRLPSPEIPTDSTGAPTADFILRSGMWLPVDESATWRPLSERGVDLVAGALNDSALGRRLMEWCSQLGCAGLNPFCRLGFNRARRVRLVWQGVSRLEASHPIEAVAELQLPESYGATVSTMQFTLDVIVRARALIAASAPSPGMQWRLDLPSLYTTIGALLESLTSPPVVEAVAALAGVEPMLVPQPGSLHFITGPPVDELLHLYRLSHIPDAGTSRGANLLADPARDLGAATERRQQVDDWLLQIALDAGLRGMEALLLEYHAEEGERR